jgi:hypothetical protein
MEKMEAFTVGIVGLAFLSFFLLVSLSMFYNYYGHYTEFWMTVYSSSAIIWSVTITLGITALVLHADKKATYFMALSTITGAMGFVPVFYGSGASSIPLGLSTILLLLVSTILFATPRKA